MRLYYHMDYLGSADYLTSPVSGKVEAWTHYNEWGLIVHNAVLKCGQRELDLVKRYATHDYDSVLELYYAKARFYDAHDRHFTAVDPILDPSEYDLREYVQNPVQFVQYLYVINNPINSFDPDGKMSVLALNIIKTLYNNDWLGSEDVSALTISMNGKNLDTAFHEIAQLNIARTLFKKGQQVELEAPAGNGEESDVSTATKIWEVKPITQILSKEPSKQLQRYLNATGKKAGHYIGVTNIPIAKNIYMGIHGSYINPGLEYYYFYKYDCDGNSIQIETADVKATVSQRMNLATALAASLITATLAEDVLSGGIGVLDDTLSIISAARIAKIAMFGF